MTAPDLSEAFLFPEIMVKAYRNQRNLLNQQIVMYEGVGIYDIPQVPSYHGELPEKWIGFNRVMQCKDPRNTGVHFFLDDYQFERIWNSPQRYINLLRQFKCVIQPDFSMYRDFPKALNIYNLFRNCWLANFWIDNGIWVIPKPGYCDYDSFEWSFDVHEKGGVVAASSVGVMFNKDDRRYFIDGYKEMIDRIQPDTVLMYGEVPKECEGDYVIHIESHQEKLHEGRKRNGE